MPRVGEQEREQAAKRNNRQGGGSSGGSGGSNQSGSGQQGAGRPQAPFFDPMLSYNQRRRQYNLSTGRADRQLQSERMIQDAKLMRPYMERRFGQQLERTAGSLANRGLTGSGLMGKKLGQVAQDQARQRGQFERELAQGLSDLGRQDARQTAESVMSGAEDVRRSAGRATKRAVNTLPF